MQIWVPKKKEKKRKKIEFTPIKEIGANLSLGKLAVNSEMKSMAQVISFYHLIQQKELFL